MKYKANIKNRCVYIRPRPKEDIKDGLVIVLNKSKGEKKEPFMKTDIEANKKEYKLPEFPPGFFVIGAFVKYEQKITQVSACCNHTYYQLDNGKRLGMRYVCKKCFQVCSLKRVPTSSRVKKL